MKKLLFILTLFTILGVLAVPIVASAIGGPPDILSKGKLKHNLGQIICSDAENAQCGGDGCLQKLKWITSGGVDCCTIVGGATEPGTACQQAGAVLLVDIIVTIGDWIFVFLLAIAGIFILVASFQFITAGGSPEKISEARTKILYALVGVAVAFVARGLIGVVVQILF